MRDDVYWTDRAKGQEYAEYVATRDALIEAGLSPLYGGTKGHGFWIEGMRKPNDGETGNAAFFSIRECERLLESRRSANVSAKSPNPLDGGRVFIYS